MCFDRMLSKHIFPCCSTGAGLWSVIYKWGHIGQFPGVNVEQASAKKAKLFPTE